MLKRKRNLFLINTAIFQIILLITISFSVSFIFSEYVGLGSAQDSFSGPPTSLRLGGAGQSTTLGGGAVHSKKVVDDKLATPSGGFWGIFKGDVFGGGPTFAGGASSLLSGLVWGGIVYWDTATN